MEAAFQYYGRTLWSFTSFKYLKRVLTASDDDCPAVVVNLRKLRRKQEMLSRILGREGGGARTSSTFYKAVVQLTLLFLSET